MKSIILKAVVVALGIGLLASPAFALFLPGLSGNSGLGGDTEQNAAVQPVTSDILMAATSGTVGAAEVGRMLEQAGQKIATNPSITGQLAAIGLAAPAGAALASAIISHYGPDSALALSNLYARLQGQQGVFEGDLTAIYRTLFTGADLATYDREIVAKGGLKLGTDGLRPIQIATVEGMDADTARGLVAPFIGARATASDDAGWDAELTRYIASVKAGLGGTDLKDVDVAARTIAVYTNKTTETVLQDVTNNPDAVKAEIDGLVATLGQNLVNFLNAAF